VTGVSAVLDKQSDVAELTLRLRTRKASDGLNPSLRLLAIEKIQSVVWE
jgi:hypothetical protein